MKKIKICASLICGNLIDLNSDLLELKSQHMIHFDVMDGQFLDTDYPEILKSVKENFIKLMYI